MAPPCGRRLGIAGVALVDVEALGGMLIAEDCRLCCVDYCGDVSNRGNSRGQFGKIAQRETIDGHLLFGFGEQ